MLWFCVCANLECKVTDSRLMNKYNLFVLKVLKAWTDPRQKNSKTIHHRGYGKFVVDGDIIKLGHRPPLGRRSATKRQSGRTPATSESSRGLSSGLCESRSRSRKAHFGKQYVRLESVMRDYATIHRDGERILMAGKPNARVGFSTSRFLSHGGEMSDPANFLYETK